LCTQYHTYAVSAVSKSQRFFPEYRCPQHNKKASNEVRVAILYYDLISGDTGSSADLEIKVVGLSHGVSVGTGLDQMLADSSVGSIELEIPGVTTEVIDVDTLSQTGTRHDPSDPLVYPVMVHNSANAAERVYHGLVKERILMLQVRIHRCFFLVTMENVFLPGTNFI
jgi:hypothetical protein